MCGGVPVTRLNLVDEATALGAAVVGGVGVGIFDSFGIAQSLSRQIATHGPDERRHARYMAEYELFLEAYQRLEALVRQVVTSVFRSRCSVVVNRLPITG